MAITVTCHNCDGKLNAPDYLAGKSARCPNCKAPLQIPAVPGKPAAASVTSRPPASAAASAPISIVGGSVEDRRPCPFCAEPILVAAKKCKHCGERLDAAAQADESGSPEPGRQPKRDSRRRSNPDDVDEPGRHDPVTSGAPVLLISLLAGGALLLLVGAGAGAWYFLSSSPNNAPPTQAAAASPAMSNPAQPTGQPGQGNQPPIMPPGVGGGNPQESTPAAQLSVDAAELVNAYRLDNATAATRYTGKILDVHGVVIGTRSEGTTGVIVELDGDKARGLRVQCAVVPSYEAKARALQQGQSVTIRGRCDGKGPIRDNADQSANVVISSCHVIAVSDGPPKAAEPRWLTSGVPASHRNYFLSITGMAHARVTLHNPMGIKYAGDARIQEVSVGQQKGLSALKYLVIRLEIRNIDGGQWLYYHPSPSSIRLADELGNQFSPVKDVQIAKEVVPAKKAMFGTDEPFILGQRQAAVLVAGEKKEDMLLFSAEHLGKGKQLLLELPGTVLANYVPGQAGAADPSLPKKVLYRLDQTLIQTFKVPAVDVDDLKAKPVLLLAGMVSRLSTLPSKPTGRDFDLEELEKHREAKVPPAEAAAKRYLGAKGLAAKAPTLTGSQEWQVATMQLAKRLQVEDEEAVELAIIEALGEVGGAAFKVWNPTMKAKRGDTQGTRMRLMAGNIYKAADQALTGAKASPFPEVRAAAVTALEKMKKR